MSHIRGGESIIGSPEATPSSCWWPIFILRCLCGAESSGSNTSSFTDSRTWLFPDLSDLGVLSRDSLAFISVTAGVKKLLFVVLSNFSLKTLQFCFKELSLLCAKELVIWLLPVVPTLLFSMLWWPWSHLFPSISEYWSVFHSDFLQAQVSLSKLYYFLGLIGDPVPHTCIVRQTNTRSNQRQGSTWACEDLALRSGGQPVWLSSPPKTRPSGSQTKVK